MCLSLDDYPHLCNILLKLTEDQASSSSGCSRFSLREKTIEKDANDMQNIEFDIPHLNSPTNAREVIDIACNSAPIVIQATETIGERECLNLIVLKL